MSDARSTALIVIDLQNDFLAPGGAYDRGGAVSAEARAPPAWRRWRAPWPPASSPPASSRCGPTRPANP